MKLQHIYKYFVKKNKTYRFVLKDIHAL